MGGGYPKSCTLMVGGEPGMGKSTIALQLSKSFSSTLYIASEQSAPEIKEVAERIGMTDEQINRVEVFDALGGAWIDAALDGPPCGLVVLDSIQGMCGTDAVAALAALKALKKHCVEHSSVGYAVDRATKEDFFAGHLDLQHEVDATLVLLADAGADDASADPDRRLIVSVKNRHGASGRREYLRMTSLGLVRAEPPPQKVRRT